MNYYIKSVLFCCLIISTQTSFSQVNYNAYKKFNYTWKEVNPPPIVIDKLFENEDAVYVDDQQLISVGGSLGSISNVMFQRKARLKFLTAEGVRKFSTLIIPESMDPLYDYHNEPFRNNKIKKGPDFFDPTLNWFAARIIKADGKVIELNFIDEFKNREVLSIIIKQTVTYKYFKSFYWNIICRNLEPGDELEYDYQLMVPYEDNYLNFNSVRIFFNGEIPCQNYSLVFKYKTGPTHDIRFINGAVPDSMPLKDNVQYHYWAKKNLYGCMDETGAQPYVTMPYVIYSLNTRSQAFRYNDAVTASFKYIPYWLAIIRVREAFDYSMRKNAAINMKDKQNLLIEAFIKKAGSGIADSMNYNKFIKVHSTIADSFKYDNDEALFRETDNRAERMGEFTEAYKIREISRQKLYAKIINELKLDYSTFYLMDKRYGKINSDYQSPIWNAEALYAVYVNKTFAMVHPKKSNTGWYVEELPFYWENTSGLILNYNDLFYDLAEKPRILNTVPSTLNDNIRMHNIKTEISLENKTVSFDAKVSLSGQFSTMTRFMYSSGIEDSINNPMYNKIITGISTPVKLKSKEITKHSNSFPYMFDARVAYESNEVLTFNKDNSVSVNLAGWFNHIIYEGMNTNNRQLDFYPDFVGQDTYRYYIKFDKPVTLLKGIDKSDITNALGKLAINISQPQSDGLLIESYFVTNAIMVPAAKIADVAQIYDAIAKLNKSTIMVKY